MTIWQSATGRHSPFMEVKPIVFAVDVGSPKNFAWASSDNRCGCDGNSLIAELAVSIGKKAMIAIGFECPLFVPVPTFWLEIGKSREGEGDRSWSGGAGGTVACYGLHEIGWLLTGLRKTLLDGNLELPGITFHPETWSSDGNAILIWEAFVSGDAKAATHVGDAQLAVDTFMQISNADSWESAKMVRPRINAASMNLAAFAARWAHWDIREEQFRENTLVVKPFSRPMSKHDRVDR